MKAMKAMKAMSAMTATKAMKAKRISKVAKGRLAKSLVFKGRKEKTVGGLKQESLMKSKRGKIVSKRASAHGKRMFRNVESWVNALMEARTSLKTTGFVAVNGKSVYVKALYVKTKALQLQRRQSSLPQSTPASSASPNPKAVSTAAATPPKPQ